MSLTFKYRREEFRDGTAYFPKIPSILYNGGTKLEAACLLDSGATDIFIPRDMADALNLELQGPEDAEGWNGTFKVWKSKNRFYCRQREPDVQTDSTMSCA